MQTRYCPSCGAEVQAADRFCRSCGHTLASEVGELQYRISPNRIVLMSSLSSGLYLFYWFYLTWKQYRDTTREEAYPIWHATAVGVPIYGYFRAHAHMRSFNELMLKASVPTTISPGRAVTWLIAITVLNVLTVQLGSGEITQGNAFAIFFIGVVSIALTIGLLLPVQENLNRYWEALSSARLLDARIGVGEVILTILGILIWLDSIATVISPDYRMGV